MSAAPAKRNGGKDKTLAPDVKKLTVRVPLDLYNKMRTFAANNDMTGEETMLAALRALLKEKP